MAFAMLAALILISYLPARLGLARWLGPLSALERVAAGIAGSFVLFFLAQMAAFLARLPRPVFHLAVPAALLALGLIAGRGARGARPWPGAAEWRMVGLLGASAALMLLMQHGVINYGGGSWSSDWYEHYERALFFDGQLGPDHRFLGVYHVAARPPFFNALAAYFMSLIGFRFTGYQVVATFLGSTVLLPAALLLRRLARRSGVLPGGETRALMLSCCLLLLHPMTVTHIIYPWTRMLACSMALLGLAFYLEAVFAGRRGLLTPALLALAAAHLTHYSAGVLAAPIVLHLVWTSVRSPGSAARRRAAVALASSASLAAVWHLWSIRVHGGGAAITSTTTWQNLRSQPAGRLLGQLATNLATTLVPFAGEVDPRFVQQMDPGLRLYALHDRLHMFWAGTLAGSISVAAILTCAVALAAGARGLRGRTGDPKREGRFLLALLAVAFLASFLVVPNVEVSGIAHLALQPISIVALLGLVVWLAAARPWAGALFGVLYGAEGLLFHYLETLPRITPTPASPSALYTPLYYENLRLKLVTHRLEFLADTGPGLAVLSRPVLLWVVPLLAAGLWFLMARRRVSAPAET